MMAADAFMSAMDLNLRTPGVNRRTQPPCLCLGRPESKLFDQAPFIVLYSEEHGASPETAQ